MNNPSNWPRTAEEARQPWAPTRTEADAGLAAMQAFVNRAGWRITQNFVHQALDTDRALQRVRRRKVAQLLREALDLLDLGDLDADNSESVPHRDEVGEIFN